jgi:outer membrane immunogenic protein
MRKLTLAILSAGTLAGGPALAADLRVPYTKAPAAVVEQAFNWSGFYIGAHGGGAWGRKDWLFVVPGTTTAHDVSGGFAGGQVGFNWQTGNFVFGVEGEGSWADLRGNSLCPNPAAVCRSRVDWMASATGRVGYAWQNVLLYAKGGWAWVGDRHFVDFGVAALNESSGDITRNGPTIGGGLEFGFWNNWSAKVEYMYVDLGRRNIDFSRDATGAFVETARIRQDLHTVKFGVNYRFGWGGPVVASY